MTKRRIYIAGPMSGLPEFNFPAFHDAARKLRALGLDVVNPAEIPEDTSAPWGELMRHALKAMLDCNTVYMLRGWTESRGAKVEWNLANSLEYEIFYQSLPEDPAFADIMKTEGRQLHLNLHDDISLEEHF